MMCLSASHRFLLSCCAFGLLASLTWSDALRPKVHRNAGSLPVLQEFNLTQFYGRFYQAWSDAAVMDTFESDGVCIFAEYGPLANGSVSVYNEMRVGTPDGEFRNITGHAVPDGSGIPGHLTVTLGAQPFPAPYWVVVTGPIYNYLYDFVIVTDMLEITMWVLVRDIPRYYQLYDSAVQVELQQLGFNKFWNSPLMTLQTGCNYSEPKPDLEEDGNF